MTTSDIKQIAEHHLSKARVMQLATSAGGQPWVCSVYFVVDEQLNIYWLSWPERRHSQELAKNPKAAVTIAIKTDLPVVGLGAEGVVNEVKNAKIVKKMADKYIEKYDFAQTFYERFIAGKNEHKMYVLKPKKYVLFDEVNFPDQGSLDFTL